MPYRAYYLDTEGELHRPADAEQIQQALDSSGVLWVDVGDTTEEDADLLIDVFGFHPLAVQRCIDPETHNPLVEDFGDYLFINTRGIDYTAEEDVLRTTDLNIFLGPNFVVTNHTVDIPSVEAVRKLVELDGRPLMNGSALMAHAHLDALVGSTFPTLDRMTDRAEEIEEQILRDPDESALAALMALKRSSLRLNRALTPQREVLSRLGRREFDLVGHESDIYFRDIFEDVTRIESANEILRERADTALTMYLSAISNRQNETMKLLSIIATTFMPLGLIAAIFGMNFQHMPGLQSRWGYPLIVAITLLGFGVVVWVLWVRGWVLIGRRALRRPRLSRFVPSAVDPTRLTTHLGRVVIRALTVKSAARSKRKVDSSGA